MSSSIIASILYVAGFVTLFAAIFLVKKSEKKLNGVMWLVLSLIVEMCWGAFAAAIINIVHIPINIYSMGVVYLVSAILLAIKIRKEKELQQYEWKLLDIIVTAAIFLGIAFMVWYKAGTDLNLVFVNSDAAVHLKNAVSVVQEQKLPTMYFAPFQTAMVLEVMMPFVAIYNFYKIFILVDALLFAVEILFFYLFCKEYFGKKWLKLAGIAMCILYAAGYPLMSYLLTFYYWAFGVMLMGAVAFLLRLYRRKEIKREYAIFAIMLACNAVTMCYMLMGPMTFIAAFVCLAVDAKQEGKLVTKGNILLAFKVFLVPTLLAVYYCYFEFLKKKAMSAAEVISIDGGIYRELYINFLLLMPLVLYMIVCAIREKKADENMIFFATIVVFTLVLFVLVIKMRVSGYYYYKFYYPLWFFAFVLAIQAIERLARKQWEVLVSYGLVFAFLFVMHFGKIEAKAIDHPANLQQENRSLGFFHIYEYNKLSLPARDITYSPEYMDICKYVVDELPAEENIPLIATQENYEKCYWYEAITGEDCSKYYGWKYSFEKITEKLNHRGATYFAIYKDSVIYQENQSYFESFSKIYENEDGAIYTTEKAE